MRVTKRLALAASLLFLVGTSQVLADPFLWLEERNGEKAMAWVAEQNARTSAELRGDPRYDPYVDTAFELFTSSDNPRLRLCPGLASSIISGRTTNTISDCGGAPRRPPTRAPRPNGRRSSTSTRWPRRRAPNWVFSNADCLAPDYRRCLIAMSPDGGDALEFREFDLASQELREGRLLLAGVQIGAELARRRHADPDAGLRRKRSRPAPAIRGSVKLWKRGTPLEQADDGVRGRGRRSSRPIAYVATDGAFADLVVGRSIDFYRFGSCSCGWRMARCGRCRCRSTRSSSSISTASWCFRCAPPWQAPDGKSYAAAGVYSLRLPAIG